MVKKTNNPLNKSSSIRGLEDDWVPSADQGIAKKIFTNEVTVNNVQVLYDTIKASPEVTACMLAQLEDIMADGWRFNSLSGDKVKAKKSIKEAKEFQKSAKYFKRSFT